MSNYLWVQEFLKDDTSPTGYSLLMLDDGKIIKLPITENVYNMQFDPKYDFPIITEYPWVVTRDENGVITHMVKGVAGENLYASYNFGVPKTIGYVVRFEGHDMIFNAANMKESLESNRIVYYDSYFKGAAVPVGDEDLVIHFRPNANIYCLNWAEHEDRHYVKDWNFVYELINNCGNCYWLSVYDYDDDGYFDTICMFRHPYKDPNTVGGDMSGDHRPGKERKAELTT
mgnify:CR=1 FL=1